MIAHSHTQIWNGAELARAFAVGEHTVRRYLDLLTGVFMLRQLVRANPRPFSGPEKESVGAEDFAHRVSPSRTVTYWPASIPVSVSVLPLGQRTRIRSTRLADPRPKWTRISLCER